jgi:hypothetical protein
MKEYEATKSFYAKPCGRVSEGGTVKLKDETAKALKSEGLIKDKK